MRWSSRSFPVEIRRNLDQLKLAEISDDEFDLAERNGFVAGNREYQDLRGFTWQEVEAALALESSIINRLKTASDLEEALAEIEEARARSIDEQEALWNLDIGVASAVLALSAIGTTPVSSCNAGAFGGHHVATHPYVAFYLTTACVDSVFRYATSANVGLTNDAAGIARIFGVNAESLIRFAEVASADHYEAWLA